MTSRSLHISDDLSLPRSIVTSKMIVYGNPGMGKRLSIDTPLPTIDGWKSMGEVRIGDVLFDERGEMCRVTYVSPIQLGDTQEVVFSDGSVILADSEHLWATEDCIQRKKGLPPAVRTTRDIADSLIFSDAGCLKRNHAIRNAYPLNTGVARRLPVDPYALGVWLGDGTSAAGQFTTADRQILEELEAVGYKCTLMPSTAQGTTASYSIRGITSGLRILKVIHNKHVPQIYLRGSISQRLALLQGLMDTDGGWSVRTAEFSNTRLELSEAVYELVVSLGMKASISPRPAKLNGEIVGTDYRVRFVPTMQVFRLKRKADRCDFLCGQQLRRKRRYIVNVRPAARVKMRCISVDSPSKLYLAGKAMIPTHNTNFGAVLLEELNAAGLRWSAIDPMGVMYGIRHSADGKDKGIECVILGGPHGDIPIEPTGGAVVADFVIHENVNTLIDISRKPNGEMWSFGERIRFMTAYGRELFRLQGSLVGGQRREPLFQLVDEAARFLPQQLRQGDIDGAACLGAWAAIAEESRNIGLGLAFLTQRSARISKDVAEICDPMIAFRTVGPNSVKAIMDWLGEHMEKARQREIIEQLRKLPVGNALIVSPGWLEIEKVVHIRLRHTFDSSATPKAGERAVRVKGAGAKPDLDKYTERMKETIERAKADDPKELRKRIAELEKQLKKPIAALPAPAVKITGPSEREKMLVQQVETLKKTAGAYERAMLNIGKMADGLVSTAAQIKEAIEQASGAKVDLPALPSPPKATAAAPSRPTPQPRRVETTRDTDASIVKGERQILIVLAQRPDGVERQPLGVIAGYSNRRTRDAYIQRLGQKGYVSTDGTMVRITTEGLAALGSYDELPTGAALREYWIAQLVKGEGDMLRILGEHPEGMTREELGEAAGYDNRRTRDAYIQRLGAKLLVGSSGGRVVINPELLD